MAESPLKCASGRTILSLESEDWVFGFRTGGAIAPPNTPQLQSLSSHLRTVIDARRQRAVSIRILEGWSQDKHGFRATGSA
jgi:hypothetical protein